MKTSEAMEFLQEEYDVIQWDGENFKCWIEYLDEWHIVTVHGEQLWGYNERTGHRWLLN